jgi:two-component system NtrC family sensor kinase
MSESAAAGSVEQELEITTRKLAEAHKMASLGRLSAGIVHEINTPIGSILSNNETVRRSLETLKKHLTAALESGQPPPEKALSILETLASLTDIDKIACERIYAVIRSLKTFARVSESDLRTVNIHEILLNTIKLSGCQFRRRVNTVTDFGEDVPEIECYPGLLNQVFLNLVVNAAQAIEGEGTVTIRTRLEGETVHISVADSGAGIPPDVRSKIFSAGFSTKPMGEGTGLGLTITREIVEDTHGGNISFETEMGKGTTFHVLIPLRQPRAEERS